MVSNSANSAQTHVNEEMSEDVWVFCLCFLSVSGTQTNQIMRRDVKNVAGLTMSLWLGFKYTQYDICMWTDSSSINVNYVESQHITLTSTNVNINKPKFAPDPESKTFKYNYNSSPTQNTIHQLRSF